jgi:hypothetical protein
MSLARSFALNVLRRTAHSNVFGKNHVAHELESVGFGEDDDASFTPLETNGN